MSITKVFLQDTDLYAGRYIQDGSIEWETEEVGEGGVLEAGVARFKTRRVALPFRPRKWMYCEMRDAGDVVRFAGRVRRVTRDNVLGVDYPQYTVEVSDWTTELKRINVTADFIWTAGDNDKNLVTKAAAAYHGQLATTGVTHKIYAAHHNMPPGEFTQGSGSYADLLEYIGGLARVASCWVDPQKALHWNDIQTLAGVVLDDVNKTGDYRSYYSLSDVDDGTDVAFRVTVIGAAGATTTVTDWPAYQEYARQRRYERGSPAVRIPQLPDHTDLTLTTVDEREAVAWVLLRQQAARRTIEVGLRGIHVYPGQIVDLIDERGRETPDFAWLDEEDLWAPGRPNRLHLKIGRFQVRSVVPQPLGGDEYDYVATLGAYRPALEQIVRAA